MNKTFHMEGFVFYKKCPGKKSGALISLFSFRQKSPAAIYGPDLKNFQWLCPICILVESWRSLFNCSGDIGLNKTPTTPAALALSKIPMDS